MDNPAGYKGGHGVAARTRTKGHQECGGRTSPTTQSPNTCSTVSPSGASDGVITEGALRSPPPCVREKTSAVSSTATGGGAAVGVVSSGRPYTGGAADSPSFRPLILFASQRLSYLRGGALRGQEGGLAALFDLGGFEQRCDGSHGGRDRPVRAEQRRYHLQAARREGHGGPCILSHSPCNVERTCS